MQIFCDMHINATILFDSSEFLKIENILKIHYLDLSKLIKTQRVSNIHIVFFFSRKIESTSM